MTPGTAGATQAYSRERRQHLVVFVGAGFEALRTVQAHLLPERLSAVDPQLILGAHARGCTNSPERLRDPLYRRTSPMYGRPSLGIASAYAVPISEASSRSLLQVATLVQARCQPNKIGDNTLPHLWNEEKQDFMTDKHWSGYTHRRTCHTSRCVLCTCVTRAFRRPSCRASSYSSR